MIHVVATIEVEPGKRAEFLREFASLAPLVRAEAGCIEYGAAVDFPTGLAAQGPVRDEVVVVVEKWDSLPALQAHLVAPHMGAYRKRVQAIVSSTRLQVLEPVS